MPKTRFEYKEQESVIFGKVNDVPSILGRINGLDVFDVRFIEGKEVWINWKT
ncbi:MAG: hypothetical protein AB1779_10505 [Candidatus Thermoplasmatota archaeon]